MRPARPFGTAPGGRFRFVFSTLLIAVALTLVSQATSGQTVVTQWNFNDKAFTPSTGSGTALVIGTGVTSSFVGGANGGGDTLAGGSSDLGTQVGDDKMNFVPRLTSASPPDSGTAGMRFSGINTTGITNALLSFDLAAVDIINPVTMVPPTTSASRWYQVRYSTDGTNFTNLGGPIEYQKTTAGFGTVVWANQTVLSLAGVQPTADLRFEIVAIHAPGTSAFAPAGTGLPYSASAPVALDMVTVFRGNTFNSTAASGSLQTAANWSSGAPSAGELSSHLVFNDNSNGAVTVTNGTAQFRALSISFGAGADSTDYTITGSQINLGEGGAGIGSDTKFGGLTTITNASNRQQTIGTQLLLERNQRWDSGSRSGGSLRFTQLITLFGPMKLEIAGSNPTTIEGGFGFFPGGDTITVNKSNGAALTIAANSMMLTTGGTAPDFVVNSGALNVTNPSGSATATGGILVNSGGRLTGHGRVQPGTGKTVTIATGGVISAGTDATNRTLTIAANGLTVQNGGKVEVNIFGTGTNDLGELLVTGAVTSPGGGVIQLSLKDGVTAANLRSAITATGGIRTYTIMTGGAGSNYSNFALADFTALGFQSHEWFISPSGNNLQLTFTLTPIPEPTTVLGVAAGLLALAGLARRRLGAKPVLVASAVGRKG